MDLTKFTDAELVWLIDNGGALVGEETRRRRGAPAARQRYRVECTISAVVCATGVRALLDAIAEQGWTVFTLLDESGVSGPMYVRDYDTNDVLGEV